MMTKIERDGRALYGEHWRIPLARALGVSDRTLRRWVNGQFRPPPGVWIELRQLMAERGEKLLELSKVD